MSGDAAADVQMGRDDPGVDELRNEQGRQEPFQGIEQERDGSPAPAEQAGDVGRADVFTAVLAKIDSADQASQDEGEGNGTGQVRQEQRSGDDGK